MVTFTNLTRGAEIGANSYLLRAGEHSVLLDAGMHPAAMGGMLPPSSIRSPTILKRF